MLKITCCWKVRTGMVHLKHTYLKLFERAAVSEELDLDFGAHGCKLEVEDCDSG